MPPQRNQVQPYDQVGNCESCSGGACVSAYATVIACQAHAFKHFIARTFVTLQSHVCCLWPWHGYTGLRPNLWGTRFGVLHHLNQRCMLSTHQHSQSTCLHRSLMSAALPYSVHLGLRTNLWPIYSIRAASLPMAPPKQSTQHQARPHAQPAPPHLSNPPPTVQRLLLQQLLGP